MKIKRLAAGLLAVLIIISVSVLPASAAFVENPPPDSSGRITVIALLDDGITASAAAAAARELSGGVKIKYIYNKLINGFAAEIDADDYTALKNIPGLKSLKAENKYGSQPVTQSEKIDQPIVADEMKISLRADPDYGGTGTVVAVLDNGFDTKHPAFKSLPASGALTGAGINALQYTLNARTSAYVSSKLPFAYDYAGSDKDVYISDSHGTGIAGIIAGNCAGYEGTAPDAQLLLMKVFDDEGNAAESDIIAALEDAVRLGADVINLSLGSPVGSDSGEPLDPALGMALRAAVKAGAIVNGAAGNDGHIGRMSEIDNNFGLPLPSADTMDYGTINAPASIGEVTAITGKNSDAEYKYCVEFDDSAGAVHMKVPFTDTTSTYDMFGKKSFTELFDGKKFTYIAVPGTGSTDDCKKAGDKLKGAIALIKRGGLTFVEKVNNACKYGAVGVVIWDNIENNKSVVNMDLTNAELPAIFISAEDGAALAEVGLGEVTITDKLLGKFPTADSGRMSDAASWGVTPSFTLKPELTATGVNVFTAAPDGKFEVMSGTSAASAVASGSAAVLIGQKRQNGAGCSPETAKRLFMNAAKPLVDPDRGIYYSPRRQGAGEISVPAAAALETSLTNAATALPKVEIPALNGIEAELELELKNTSDKPMEYKISCTVQGDDYKTLDDGENTATADLCEPRAFEGAKAILNGREININNADFMGEVVTLNAGESARLNIKIKLDEKTAEEYKKIFKDGFYLEGFVTAESSDGTQTATLPFVCFTGDWEELPILNATVYDHTRVPYYLNSCFFAQSRTLRSDIILGLNQCYDGYDIDASRVSFSPDGDGELDEFYMTLTLLRSAVNVTGEIIASDGEIVADMGTLDYVSKTTAQRGYLTELNFKVWDGTSADNSAYVFPDGRYKLILIAYPAYEGSKAQKYIFPFTVDTRKPIVAGVKLKTATDGKETLVLNVKDETALQGAVLYQNDIALYSGMFNSAHSAGVKTNDIYEFDITGWRDTEKYTVYVDVYDFAMNRTTVMVKLDSLAGIIKERSHIDEAG